MYDSGLSDAARIFDALTPAAQQDLLEILVRKAALNSPSFQSHLGSTSPHSSLTTQTSTSASGLSQSSSTLISSAGHDRSFDSSSDQQRPSTGPLAAPYQTSTDTWSRIVNTVEYLRQQSTLASTAASSLALLAPFAGSGSTYASPESLTGDAVYFQPHAEIQPILATLRIIQRMDARQLFDDVQVHLNGTRGKNNANSVDSKTLPKGANPFAHVETEVLNILLQTPYILLTPKKPSKDPKDSRPSTPLGSRDDASPLVAQIIQASIYLTSLIEAIITTHNDQILKNMTDKTTLTEYEKVSVLVWEGASGILRDVIKLREWDPELGKWHDARAIYSSLISNSQLFANALLNFVEFSWKILKPTFVPKKAEKPPLADQSYFAMADARDQPPPSPTSARSSMESHRSVNLGRDNSTSNKRRSFGARLLYKFNQLTQSVDKRKSLQSMSSDDESFFSRASSRLTHSTDSEVQRTQQSLDMLRQTSDSNPASEYSRDGSESRHRRVASDAPPQLPEIDVRITKKAPLAPPAPEAPIPSTSSQSGYSSRPRSNSQILQKPSATGVRLRVVSNEPWGVNLPSQEQEIPNTNRWSQMVNETVQPVGQVAEGHLSRRRRSNNIQDSLDIDLPFQMPAGPAASSDESLPQPSVDLADVESVPSPTTSSNGTLGRSNSAGFGNAVKQLSKKASISGLRALRSSSSRQSLNTSGNAANSAGANQRRFLFPNRFKSTERLGVFRNASDSEMENVRSASQRIEPSDDGLTESDVERPSDYALYAGPRGLDLSRKEDITSDEESTVPATKAFKSMRVIGRKGAQKIPTVNSRGKRIGMYNNGKLSYDTADDDKEEYSGVIQVRDNMLHLSEGKQDIKIMEIVAGKIVIVAATVEKLVVSLADENLQDLEFVDCMIHNHGFFMSSQDLMDNLEARYDIEPPPNASTDDMEYFHRWKTPIQRKVLNVLARWVKLQYEDFANDADLRHKLEEFLTIVWGDGFKSEADRIRRTCITQAVSLAMKRKNTPFAVHLDMIDAHGGSGLASMVQRLGPTSCHFPRTDSPNLLDLSPILTTGDARDYARYLTAVDALSFAAITFPDYVAKLREPRLVGEAKDGLRDGLASGPEAVPGKIDLFARRANMIRNWVALEICSIGTLNVRRQVIERFIQIAKYCIDFNNFHTAFFIVSGLLTPAVQRHKKTWEAVSSKHIAALETLEKLMDPSGNMRNYRKALAQVRGPAVPFFPMVMKDITFLMDGNPAMTKPRSKSSSRQQQPLINFEKYRNISKILTEYRSFVVTEKYDFAVSLAPLLRFMSHGSTGVPVLSSTPHLRNHPEALAGALVESRLVYADDEFVFWQNIDVRTSKVSASAVTGSGVMAATMVFADRNENEDL
ncbi:ras guanine nucleotide exchange factor domain-containing protein [Polychytrium aggregatum]|uniref:ras guanine nucleotide exchange factor domain-containing protein n=1 Tax=Polychytrium aggregatum TaxID=110093 RepID=UPI0022FED3E0|nr:ras guanine nucleotide exchange factor domain-containing protein [Polychytrium aggregatum]KAI9199258.1 ras guanine nucleotide exchange factor domain-containing protein [Polychytrium aggregatum]